MDYSFAYLVGIAFWIYLFTVGSGILADRKQRGVWAWALLGFIFGPFAFATILLLGPARSPHQVGTLRAHGQLPASPHGLTARARRPGERARCARFQLRLASPAPSRRHG